MQSNPYLAEANYPYPSQQTQVVSPSIKVPGESDSVAIRSRMLLMVANPARARRVLANISTAGSANASASANSSSDALVCATKNGQAWVSDLCQTVDTRDRNGKPIKACSCKSLGPTTILDDVDGVFSSSKTSQIFSGAGLSALAHFNPVLSLLFWIIVVKTFFWIVFMAWGYRADKKFLEQNPHLRDLNVEQILE